LKPKLPLKRSRRIVLKVSAINLNDGTVREHRMKFGSRLAEKLRGEAERTLPPITRGKRIAIFAPLARRITDMTDRRL